MAIPRTAAAESERDVMQAMTHHGDRLPWWAAFWDAASSSFFLSFSLSFEDSFSPSCKSALNGVAKPMVNSCLSLPFSLLSDRNVHYRCATCVALSRRCPYQHKHNIQPEPSQMNAEVHWSLSVIPTSVQLLHLYLQSRLTSSTVDLQPPVKMRSYWETADRWPMQWTWRNVLSVRFRFVREEHWAILSTHQHCTSPRQWFQWKDKPEKWSKHPCNQHSTSLLTDVLPPSMDFLRAMHYQSVLSHHHGWCRHRQDPNWSQKIQRWLSDEK